MKTIIVTGGAGFIGSNLVHYLLAKTSGFRIVVFDKLTYAGNKLNLAGALSDTRVRFVKGDISDTGSVRALFKAYKPLYLFNLAAESHVDRSIDGPGAFVKTNLDGTFQMLEGARRYWLSLPENFRKKFRFLHVSTDEVYGSLGKRGSFLEETPYAPNSPYSATKAGADHLVRAYQETYGLPLLLTNCSNNYGPCQFPEKLVPLMILTALEGKSLPIYGDGGNVRDWLYVEDHCEALWRVMTRAKPGARYNIGGRGERTNLQVVRTLCQLLEKALPAAKNPAFINRGISHYTDLMTFVKDRPGHDRRYAMNASKIKRELGWKPRHDFGKGMEKTVEWYMANLEWCDLVQSAGNARVRLGLGKSRIR